MITRKVVSFDGNMYNLVDLLNDPHNVLVSYKIPYKYDNELGLMVNLELQFQEVNEPWDYGESNRKRMIELCYSATELNLIINSKETQVIKIHEIKDHDKFCYVVDYYFIEVY